MKGKLPSWLVVLGVIAATQHLTWAAGRLSPTPAAVPVSIMATYQGGLGNPHVSVSGDTAVNVWRECWLTEGRSAGFAVTATDVSTFMIAVAPPAGYDAYIDGVLRSAAQYDGYRSAAAPGTPTPGTRTMSVTVTLLRQTSSDSAFLAPPVEVDPLGAASSIQFGVPYYDDSYIDDLWRDFPRLDLNLGTARNGRPLPPLKVALFPRTSLTGDAPEVPDLPDVSTQTVGSAIHIRAPQVTAIFALSGAGPGYTVRFAVPGQEAAPFLTYAFGFEMSGGPYKCTVIKTYEGAAGSMVTAIDVNPNLQNAISFAFDDWHEAPAPGQAAVVPRRVVVDGTHANLNYATITVTAGAGSAEVVTATRIDYHRVVTPVALEDGTVYPYRRWVPREETEGYGSAETFVTTHYVGDHGEPIGHRSPSGAAVITRTSALRLPSFSVRTWLDQAPQHSLTWTNGEITAVNIAAGNAAQTDFTYVNDWNGIARLPSAARTKVATASGPKLLAESSTVYDFDPVGSAAPVLVANGQPYVVGTTYAFAEKGTSSAPPRPATDGPSLRTITKRYRERSGAAAGEQFLVGLPYSVQQPDDTKTSYAYEWGELQADGTFRPGSGADLRLTALHGVAPGAAGASTTAALPSGTAIDPIGLVANRSTKVESIRRRGFLMRVEQFVYSGNASTPFESIAWQTYSREADGRLLSRRSSTNAAATITWHPHFRDRKLTEEDETGLVSTFGYDAMGRLIAVSTAAAGPVPARRVEYAYDADHRLLRHSVAAGDVPIVTENQYNTAGRLKRRIEPGNVVIDYAYADGGATVTATVARGTAAEAARTTARFADGRLRQITGSAAVAEFHQYESWDSSDRPIHTVRLGDEAFAAPTGRTRSETTDCLGRVVAESTYGFGPNGSSSPVMRRFDFNARGQLRQITTVQKPNGAPERRLVADTLFSYDLLGQLTASGLDVNGSGALEESGPDRFAAAGSEYFKDTAGLLGAANAWWAHTTRKHYYKNDASAAALAYHVTHSYARLGSLPAGMSAQAVAQDFFNNSTVSTITFEAGGQRREWVERADGTRVERKSVAGLVTQERIFSDAASLANATALTTTYEYDGQGRLTKTTDPRGIAARQSFQPGTWRVHQTFGRNRTNTADVLLSTMAYDAAGRVAAVQDEAKGTVVYTTYWPAGQPKDRWGTGTHPIHFEYDALGQRRELWTYREGNTGTPDRTTWVYDPNTGWLTAKIDAAAARQANGDVAPAAAAGHAVTYDYAYTGAHRTVTRTWARSPAVVTTWQYRLDTGDLENVLYSDNTPDVTYGYTRSGRLESVDEVDPVTGTKRAVDLTYHREQLAAEIMDANYFGGLILTRRFQDASALDRAGHLVPGRADGFMLGYSSAAVPTADLNREFQVGLAYDEFGRVKGVTPSYKEWVAPGPARTAAAFPFVYQFLPNTSWWQTLTQGSYALTRTFEEGRDVLTSITATRGEPLAQFTYATNAAGERVSALQAGKAFGDLGAGSYFKYAYNETRELTAANGYLGADPAVAAGLQPMNGRQFGFSYDTAGSRRTVTVDGETASYRGAANGAGLPGANALNQVISRGTLRSHASGTADPAAVIKVGGVTVDRAGQGSYWDQALSGFGKYAELPVAATLSGAANESASIWQLVRPALENFTYDADGNLTDDGLWHYTWDAENRLVAMSTSAAVAAWGAPLRALTFTYDYLGRRIRNVATVGGATTDRKYVYDGWNLIAELDGATNKVVRTYVWGDGLLLETVHANTTSGSTHTGTTLTAYQVARDGNGNVAALIHAATGAVAASYEYGPFGEPLRTQVADALVAANPFRGGSYQTDPETGLVYYGYRYYDPSLGRFLSRDPIEESGGTNLYAFARNDGINGGDYLGLADTRGSNEGGDTSWWFPWPFWPRDPVVDDISQTEPNVRQSIWASITAWFGPPKEFKDPVAANNRQLETSGADGEGRVGLDVEFPHEFLRKIRAEVYFSENYQEIAARENLFAQIEHEFAYNKAAANPSNAEFWDKYVAEPILTVAMFADGAMVLGRIAAARVVVSRVGLGAIERAVLFGQRRIGPKFSTKIGMPDYLSGRFISDVAVDLRNGLLTPEMLPVRVFEFEGSLVSINNRTLAAFSEAGMQPSRIIYSNPTASELNRLFETTIIDSPLPGPLIPVTPSISSTKVIRVIEIPGLSL